MLFLAVFLSLDYGLPIVWRDEKVTIVLDKTFRLKQVVYKYGTFFTLVLLTSLLVPISALFYAVFKWDSRLPDIPRLNIFKYFCFLSRTLLRVTIFWRNQNITPLAVAATLAIGITIVAITLLTILGRCFLIIEHEINQNVFLKDIFKSLRA